MNIRSFEQWQESMPEAMQAGPLWKTEFYRKALFLYDLCWLDTEPWLNDARGKAIAQQIIRSCGSIGANIEEGYGRGFGRDYARFLTIAVGSARETQGWYVRARHLLKPETFDHRYVLCDEIIGLLVRTVNHQRQQSKT